MIDLWQTAVGIVAAVGIAMAVADRLRMRDERRAQRAVIHEEQDWPAPGRQRL